MADAIGFIGLGGMGTAMVGRLLAAGFRVRVWNRTAAKAQALAAQGAAVAASPADVAAPGGVVVTMLADDLALREVAGRGAPLVARLGPGGVHVSMSTIAPATASALAAEHAEAGVAYVAAPVLGRPDAAAAGKLWILPAGAAAAKTRVAAALKAMGQGTVDFGERPERANVAKLICNFSLAAAMEAMAEGFTLGAKHGLDPRQIADLLGGTLFACPAYQGYGARIAAGQFEPAGFRLALGLKDVALALGAAAAVQAPMPLASLVHDRLLGEVAKGRGDADWSALARGVREAAGLD